MTHTNLSLPESSLSGELSSTVKANGVELYYVQKGSGPNLILLHGGLGSSNQWAKQFDAFAEHFTVYAFDSRAHGRSTRDERPLGIHLMAEDIVDAMDVLGLASASILGFSDGGNIGLDIALNHPEKLEKLITYGANFSPEGANPEAGTAPLLGEYVGAMAAEYASISKTEESFEAFSAEVFNMWGTQPNFTTAQLRSILSPVMVMHGRHEEAILFEHSQLMADSIPNGELFVMETESHFGLWQNAKAFNEAVLAFLR